MFTSVTHKYFHLKCLKKIVFNRIKIRQLWITVQYYITPPQIDSTNRILTKSAKILNGDFISGYGSGKKLNFH